MMGYKASKASKAAVASVTKLTQKREAFGDQKG